MSTDYFKMAADLAFTRAMSERPMPIRFPSPQPVIDSLEYEISHLHQSIAELTLAVHDAHQLHDLKRLLKIRQEIEPLIAALETTSDLSLTYADQEVRLRVKEE